MRNRILAEIICNQEFFKVQLVHFLGDNTSDWNRNGLFQCNSQQASAADKPIPVFLPQELEHSQKLRIMLNFINENQCIFISVQLGSCDHT